MREQMCVRARGREGRWRECGREDENEDEDEGGREEEQHLPAVELAAVGLDLIHRGHCEEKKRCGHTGGEACQGRCDGELEGWRGGKERVLLGGCEEPMRIGGQRWRGKVR